MAGNTPRFSNSFAAEPPRSGHAARYRSARSAASARGSGEGTTASTSTAAAAVAAAAPLAVARGALVPVVARGALVPSALSVRLSEEGCGSGQEWNWERVTEVREVESG